MSKYIELPNHHSVVLMMNGPRGEELDLAALAEEAETIQQFADLEKRQLTAEEGARIDEIWHEFKHIQAGSRREFIAKLSEPQPRTSEPTQPGGPYTGWGQKTVDNRAHVVLADGRKLPLLASNEKLADFVQPARGEQQFSIADFCAGAMGLKPMATTTSSTATVSPYIGSKIVDAVRAASRVIEAGATTIPLYGGPCTIAKIVSDPTIFQHSEGVADISESDLTLAPIALNPAFLVAAVPVSAELIEDSVNVEQALTMSLAAAFALKLDQLIIAKLLASTDILDSASAENCATWQGVMAALGNALAADQELPGARISNPADFAARHAQQAMNVAGTENVSGWLGCPEVLKPMKDLFTSSMTAGHSVFGNFAKGVGVAIRSDLRLELLRWEKYTSATHILYAHARMDGYILQPKHLYRQLTTV